MTDESLETKLARLEGKFDAIHEKTERHDRALYGEGDGKNGIIAEQQILKAENRYLRYVYALVTAVVISALSWLTNRVLPHIFPPAP